MNPTNPTPAGTPGTNAGVSEVSVQERLSELVTLHQGDCLAIAPTLADIGAVVSDPPYGMDWNTDSKRFTGGASAAGRGEGRDDWGSVHGDDEPFDPVPWLEYPKAILWGASHYAARLPLGTSLVWLKKPDHLFGTFLSDAEIGWMKGGHGVYAYRDTTEYMAVQLNKLHPTQKPVGLMRWCIRRLKLPAGTTILDPYAGSGTTAIAATLEGFPCVLIEKDAGYCSLIRKRIAKLEDDGMFAPETSASRRSAGCTLTLPGCDTTDTE